MAQRSSMGVGCNINLVAYLERHRSVEVGSPIQQSVVRHFAYRQHSRHLGNSLHFPGRQQIHRRNGKNGRPVRAIRHDVILINNFKNKKLSTFMDSFLFYILVYWMSGILIQKKPEH